MDNTPENNESEHSPQLIAVLDELLTTLEKQASVILSALEEGQQCWRQETALAVKEGAASPTMKSYVNKTLLLSNEIIDSISSKRQRIERIRKSALYLHEQLKTTDNIFAMDLLTDTLTDTYSRFAMDHILKKNMESTDANGEHKKIMLAITDIDYLSIVNKEHGRETGDTLLKQFGQTANLTLRNTDYVIRYGGDEFMLVMTETDLSNSRIAVERIRNQLKEAPLILKDYYKTSIPIKFSAGIAPLHWDGDPEHTIAAALSALSTAQKSGGNCTKITSISTP